MWEPVGPLPVAVYWRRRGVAAIAALALATLTVWGATTATSTPQESTVTTRAALSNPQLGVDGGDPIADGAAGTAGPVSGTAVDGTAGAGGTAGAATGGPQPDGTPGGGPTAGVPTAGTPAAAAPAGPPSAGIPGAATPAAGTPAAGVPGEAFPAAGAPAYISAAGAPGPGTGAAAPAAGTQPATPDVPTGVGSSAAPPAPAAVPPATTPGARGTSEQLQPDLTPRAAPVATPVAVPPTGPVPCTNAMTGVTAEIDRPTHKVGERPVLRLVVTNTSPQPCVRDLDASRQEIVVWSGDGKVRLWSSNDCGNAGSPDLRTLIPGQPVAFAVTWAGRTSTPSCAAVRTAVPAGSYRVMTRLDDDISAPTPFQLTA
jgi:hypothetical protein